MTGTASLREQDRALGLTATSPREQRRHLARVARIDARIALGGGEQNRRVLSAVMDVVIRRVGVQPAELCGDVGIAVRRSTAEQSETAET